MSVGALSVVNLCVRIPDASIEDLLFSVLAISRHRNYLVVCVPAIPGLSVPDFASFYFFAPFM